MRRFSGNGVVPNDGKDLLVVREKRGYRPLRPSPHIFGGPFRKKSEKYGLVVYLCHHDCHIFGHLAAHQNADTMLRIKQYGQEKAMRENGWSTQDFIREFGKNYL